MSCGDYIIETMGEASIKCVKKVVNIVGLSIKGVIHASELMSRSALFLGEAILKSIKHLHDEQKIRKEIRETEACQQIEELYRMLGVNFEKLDAELENTPVYDDEFSPQYMKAVVEAYLKIAEEFIEEREIIFPYDMYQELMELQKIDFLNLDDEEIDVCCQRMKVFLDNANLVTERSKAVIFALRGEEYIPNVEFSEEEIIEACRELHRIWMNFEREMNCEHLNADCEDSIRVKNIHTETVKIDQSVKAKERPTNA